jgi:EAL domain-containing protein (putative c-di-GMP-specific phosphodiesterase class I)
MQKEMDISSLKVLVVDDEAFVLKLTVRILSKLGYDDVVTADNGVVALGEIDNVATPFDVIICDLNMPEMDGIAFMRHAADRNVSAGMILLSGEDERMLETARDLAAAHKLHILGVISKPLKPDALSNLLNTFQPTAVVEKQGWHQEEIPETELLDGINSDQLHLVYQPKVNISTGEVTGVETLARWMHPEKGLLGPGAFIPLAEETGHIDQLTCAIYRKAMHQAGDWLAQGITMKISVNISVNSFTAPGFTDFLIETAQNEGMDLSNVVLEVTETQVMDNALGILETLMRLRMKRFALSIDDFGTGNASMEQLKRIPFSELKIDRAFVFGAAKNAGARAILESSVTLAKSLKMDIVAEGAEGREDWDLLESLGVDTVQGFYCAKPMNNADLMNFLEDWTGPH